jgi:hypothetical protein
MQGHSEEFERTVMSGGSPGGIGLSTAGMFMSLLIGHPDFELSIDGTEIALTNTNPWPELLDGSTTTRRTFANTFEDRGRFGCSAGV